MSDNRYEEFLLLQLAEAGRWMEQIAQFLASVWVSSETPVTGATVLADLGAIFNRTSELLEDESQIWPHLLPGGSQGDPLEHPDTTHLHKLIELLNRERPQVHGDAKAWNIIGDLNAYLQDERLVSANEPEPEGVDVVVINSGENMQGFNLVMDEQGQLYKWDAIEFTHLSLPGSKSVGEGDVIRIHNADFTEGLATKVDFSEIHELLN